MPSITANVFLESIERTGATLAAQVDLGLSWKPLEATLNGCMHVLCQSLTWVGDVVLREHGTPQTAEYRQQGIKFLGASIIRLLEACKVDREVSCLATLIAISGRFIPISRLQHFS